MLRDQSDEMQDSLVLSNRLISELNIDSIHSYRMLFKNVKGNHVWTRLSDEDFLFKLGAIGRSPDDGKLHPTLGGLVFFGDYQAITAELPGYFLDYREHGTNDTRWTDRICSGDGNWSGNIFDFYYKIFDKMTACFVLMTQKCIRHCVNAWPMLLSTLTIMDPGVLSSTKASGL